MELRSACSRRRSFRSFSEFYLDFRISVRSDLHLSSSSTKDIFSFFRIEFSLFSVARLEVVLGLAPGNFLSLKFWMIPWRLRLSMDM